MSSLSRPKKCIRQGFQNRPIIPILPRRIFVFLWVFHKLVITPLQVSDKVSPFNFHLLARAMTRENGHWSTALSVLPDAKITELMSIPDQRWTVHFTWSPGAAKL